MSGGPSDLFGARAPSYDELRPQDGPWWERFHVLVREGDLGGRRVLDVGCGTGALAAALVERAGAKVWGVDPSSEMLAVARARLPAGVGLKLGHAEELPFRDGWFERLTMSLVVHLLDRPRAFSEARRVLARGGRLALATFAAEHFDTYWLNDFFPSLAEVDRQRFPTAERLVEELGRAGLGDVRTCRISSELQLGREEALARIRGRHISTFDLLDPIELAEGTARAEHELPYRVTTRLEQLVVVADRLPD
jgi:ubiquinone/menaquinone biosynthesis C-methylase UbiE